MALDQRQQRIVILGALFVLGAGAYWYLDFSPKKAERALARVQLDSLIQLNHELDSVSRGGSLDELKGEADRFTQELALMRRLVPSENEVPALILSISQAARAAGLEVADLTPAGTLPGDQFDVVRYKIAVVGPYHRVAMFLTNVASLERIVAPMNLGLTIGPPAIGDRKPRRNEVFVNAAFEIQTYVAKTAPPAARSSKSSGGM